MATPVRRNRPTARADVEYSRRGRDVSAPVLDPAVSRKVDSRIPGPGQEPLHVAGSCEPQQPTGRHGSSSIGVQPERSGGHAERIGAVAAPVRRLSLCRSRSRRCGLDQGPAARRPPAGLSMATVDTRWRVAHGGLAVHSGHIGTGIPPGGQSVDPELVRTAYTRLRCWEPGEINERSTTSGGVHGFAAGNAEHGVPRSGTAVVAGPGDRVKM